MQLLEIERELAGPERDAALARHDAVLASLDARLGAALAAGLAPEDYARAEQLRAANLIARKLLRLAVQDGAAS